MSIEMLTGTTGGGKSYHACNHIIPEILKNLRPVVTNLPLNMPWWQEKFPEHHQLIRLVDKTSQLRADLEQGKSIADYESGHELDAFYGDVRLTEYPVGHRPHVIVDEAAGIWSKQRTTDEHRDFFDHHRHFGLDILLIVQDERKLDPAVRYNVEMVHKVENLQQRGIKGLGAKYVFKTWQGNSANTAKRPDREPTNYTFDVDGYEAYQSRMFGGNVANHDAVGSKNVWLNWRFFLLIGFFVMAVFFVFYFDGLRILRGPSKQEAAPATSTATTPGSRRSLPSRAFGGLTFAGSIRVRGETVFLVSKDGRTVRRVLPGDLLRMDIELRPASGCAAWRISRSSNPELIHCGDNL